ncbi:MAG: long-chain-fatty-acid--CoA ligase [SAR202 cluster bacterium]|nr:long-chain-fatty-acid--CoA ligase [SAR202 cluster bacterium]
MNISEFLTIASAIVPDRTALIFDDQTTTFAQLKERVDRLANALADLGVGRGDRIAVMQVNCPQAVEACFAAAQLDAIYTPLNFRAKAEELAQMLEIARPSVLLVGERYLPLVAGGAVPPEHTFLLDAPPAGNQPSYEASLAQAPGEQLHFPEASDDDTAAIVFTAGTTGVPKGVMLTHDSFASYILANVTPADPDTTETNLLTVPLYHVAGLQAALSAVYGGRTLLIMRQFEPLEWLELAQKYQAGRAMLVPTMLKQLMEHPQFHEFDLSALKVITYGAAPMPVAVIRQAIQEFPHARFINAFGQTETASTITMLPPEDHVLEGSPEEIEKKLKHLSSIGKPLEDVEVSIVSEDGAPVAPGQVGEIAARGPRMMKGYWRQEGATQETLRSGWVYTGDLAYQDEDGYIYLAGRAKDFIKRGGEMISPEEVEQVLMAHPQVAEAAVIGVPDAHWGEEVRALVVLKPGRPVSQEKLEEFCRQRLASFKRPRSVVFLPELPRNSLGKVLKRELRQQHGYPIQRQE